MSRIHKCSSPAAAVLLESDFAACCRWCLAKSGKMSPVFGSSLDQMLRSIASLEMSEGDPYPQQACSGCIKTLSISYRFQQMVLSNHKTLVDVLRKRYSGSETENAAQAEEDPIPKKIEYVQTIRTKANEANESVMFKTKLSTAEELEIEPEILDSKDSLLADVNINAEISRKEDVCKETDVEMCVSKYIDEDNKGVEEESTASVEEDTNKEGVKERSTYSVEEDINEEGVKRESTASVEEDINKEGVKKESTASVEEDINKEGVKAESTMSDEEETKAIKCPHCPVLLNNELNLKIHLITHKEPCKVCKKPISREGLARHMRTHAVVKPNVCRFCQRRFSDRSNLARHVASHTKEGSGKEGLCPLCGKKFKYRSSLHKHMRYHTGAGLHKCQVCSKAFSSPSTLKVHMLKHQDRRFECRECASTFSQKSSLSKHARVAHCGPRRLFVCAKCAHVFMSKESLELHMSRTHRGDKPYKCRQCDRAFAYPKSLSKHTSSHDKNGCKKPSEKDVRTIGLLYFCMKCGLEFDTDEHMKIHTKSCTTEPQRPVVPKPPIKRCEMCTQVFPKCEQLLAHYSSAHNLVLIKEVEEHSQ